jgi:energy-coupling factor transporter ATP-binding protein EcfA2
VPAGKRAEVHLIVGPNGCGKTRLLCLLAAALGNRRELDLRLVPKERQGMNCSVYGETLSAEKWRGEWRYQTQYVSWAKAGKRPSKTTTASFDQWPGEKTEQGRLLGLAFEGWTPIPDVPLTGQRDMSAGPAALRLVFVKEHADIVASVQFLANLVFDSGIAHGSQHDPLSPPSVAVRTLDRFHQALKKALGSHFTLAFSRSFPCLVAHWQGSEIPLGSLPDGLRSIIAWLGLCVARLYQAFPESDDPLAQPFVLLLDEIESHLHPRWQSIVLRIAQYLFPHAQIFAATHSAFVISSINEGFIHLIKPTENSAVPPHMRARQMEVETHACGQADSYLDAMQDILGVTSFYDPVTEELLANFRTMRDSVYAGELGQVEALQSLASTLARRGGGLSEMMGSAMRQVRHNVALASTPAQSSPRSKAPTAVRKPAAAKTKVTVPPASRVTTKSPSRKRPSSLRK